MREGLPPVAQNWCYIDYLEIELGCARQSTCLHTVYEARNNCYCRTDLHFWSQQYLVSCVRLRSVLCRGYVVRYCQRCEYLLTSLRTKGVLGSSKWTLIRFCDAHIFDSNQLPLSTLWWRWISHLQRSRHILRAKRRRKSICSIIQITASSC